MADAVSLVTTAARPFAAVRGRLLVDDVPRRFREFLDQVYAVRDQLPLDGQNIFLYRPAGGAEADVDFGVGVTAEFQDIGPVGHAALPAGKAAMLTVRGPYTGLRAGHLAVTEWCRRNGHALSGTRWEIYGHWSDDPAGLRTDIFHQLA